MITIEPAANNFSENQGNIRQAANPTRSRGFRSVRGNPAACPVVMEHLTQ